MAGETIRTEGIVLRIHPWSHTSHIVTWLTPDHGPVTTVVKGAVRPNSAFLGQYDFFYTCELLYYAHASGEAHALREATPINRRDGLRGRWRETALAGYAADWIAELAPVGCAVPDWYTFLTQFLDELADLPPSTRLLSRFISLEMTLLTYAGLKPDFNGFDPTQPFTPFAIDQGRCGTGARTIHLTAGILDALQGRSTENEEDAVRFLGVFLAYHLERPSDIRRSLVSLLATPYMSIPG